MLFVTTQLKSKPTPITKVIRAASVIPAKPTQTLFDKLSDDAWVRESQLVRSPSRSNCTAPLPFSSATLWRQVAAGTFPAPKKLSTRVTAWRVGSVREWIANK